LAVVAVVAETMVALAPLVETVVLAVAVQVLFRSLTWVATEQLAKVLTVATALSVLTVAVVVVVPEV
jgi:hypothetical protein